MSAGRHRENRRGQGGESSGRADTLSSTFQPEVCQQLWHVLDIVVVSVSLPLAHTHEAILYRKANIHFYMYMHMRVQEDWTLVLCSFEFQRKTNLTHLLSTSLSVSL